MNEMILDSIMTQAIKSNLTFEQASKRVKAYFSCIDWDYTINLDYWERVYNEPHLKAMYQ